MESVGLFIFLYPIIMSIIWMIGASYFAYRYERKVHAYPELETFPFISVLIPARNEEECIGETVNAILKTEYPNYEIIIVDDASEDRMGRVIEGFAKHYPQVRTLTLKSNMGKAAALNAGFLLSKGEIIVTIDADCLLDSKALHWMAWHFVKYPRVGAVTGNPRVRNRTTLLAKIQTGEYASIIGLIKRTQRLLGKVLTVSGVIAAFRKQALLDCGLWDTDMVTDDINVTWKLEKKFWDIHYELNAIGWILVPETIRGLWNQRVRWAQGGIEVLRKHADIWTEWRERRLLPIYIDYVLSIIWSFVFVIFTSLWVAANIFGLQVKLGFISNPVPMWTGSVVALICLLQFAVSFILDRKYDKTLSKHYFWVIWYPVIYWIFSALAVIWATPKALTKKFGTRAVWISPDRGLRVVEKMEGV